LEKAKLIDDAKLLVQTEESKGDIADPVVASKVAGARQALALAQLEVDPASEGVSDLVAAVGDAIQANAAATHLAGRSEDEARKAVQALKDAKTEAEARAADVKRLPTVPTKSGTRVHGLYVKAVEAVMKLVEGDKIVGGELDAARQALDKYDLAFKAHEQELLHKVHTTPFTVVSAYSAWLPQPPKHHKATAAPLANTEFVDATKPEIVRGRVVDMALRTSVDVMAVTTRHHNLKTATEVAGDQGYRPGMDSYWVPAERDSEWYSGIEDISGDELTELSKGCFETLSMLKRVWYAQTKNWLKDPNYTYKWLQSETTKRQQYMYDFINRFWIHEHVAYPIMSAAVKLRDGSGLKLVVASDSLHYSKLYGVAASASATLRSHDDAAFITRTPAECVWVTAEHLLQMAELVLAQAGTTHRGDAAVKATYFHIAMLIEIVQEWCEQYDDTDPFEMGYDDEAVHYACEKRNVVSYLKLREATAKQVGLNVATRLIPTIAPASANDVEPKYLEMKYLSHTFPSRPMDGENPWAGEYRGENTDRVQNMGDLTFVKSYFKYRAGPFTAIFPGRLDNATIAQKCGALRSRLLAGEDVFVFGYGPSGAGKTSSLIYFNGGKGVDAPKAAMGIVPELLVTLGATELKVSIVEYMDRGLIDDGKMHEVCIDLLSNAEVSRDMVGLQTMRFDGQGSPHPDDAGVVGEQRGEDPVPETGIGQYIVYFLDRARTIKPTTNNPESSRSHAVIYVEIVLPGGRMSRVAIGDFAGVENEFQCNHVSTQREFEKVLHAPTHLIKDVRKDVDNVGKTQLPSEEYGGIPELAEFRPDADPGAMASRIDDLRRLRDLKEALDTIIPALWSPHNTVPVPVSNMQLVPIVDFVKDHAVLLQRDEQSNVFFVSSLLNDTSKIHDTLQKRYLRNLHAIYTTSGGVNNMYGLECNVHESQALAEKYDLQKLRSYMLSKARGVDPASWTFGTALGGPPPPTTTGDAASTYYIANAISKASSKFMTEATDVAQPVWQAPTMDPVLTSNRQSSWRTMRDRVWQAYRKQDTAVRTLNHFLSTCPKEPGAPVEKIMYAGVADIMQSLGFDLPAKNGVLLSKTAFANTDFDAIIEQCEKLLERVVEPNWKTTAHLKTYCEHRRLEGVYINKSLALVGSFLQARMHDLQVEQNEVPHYPRGCMAIMCESSVHSCGLHASAANIPASGIVLTDHLKLYLGSSYTPAIMTVLNLEPLPYDKPPKPYIDFADFEKCVMAFKLCNSDQVSQFDDMRREQLMSEFKFLSDRSEYERIVWLLMRRIAYLGDFSKRQDGFGKADAVSLADILLTTLGEQMVGEHIKMGILNVSISHLEEALRLLTGINSVSAIGCLKFTDQFARGMGRLEMCSQAVLDTDTPAVPVEGGADSLQVCKELFDAVLAKRRNHKPAIKRMQDFFKDHGALRTIDQADMAEQHEFSELVTPGVYLPPSQLPSK
jgi:hypothetical protein